MTKMISIIKVDKEKPTKFVVVFSLLPLAKVYRQSKFGRKGTWEKNFLVLLQHSLC